MFRVRLKVSKDAPAAVRRLRQVGARVGGAWGSLPSLLLDALVDHARRDFPPSGLAPLRPSTEAIRRRLGHSGSMLVRTGHLRDSITRFRLGLSGGSFGADVPYAFPLHEGDGAKLPPRPFLLPSERAIDAGLGLIARALEAR